MLLKQYYLGCLAHASYLIGDEASGVAVVVDPRRDVQLYLDEAAAHKMTVQHVVLTHFHADFVAGHLELRDRTGAEIHLGACAEAEYAFAPVHDGDPLDLGANVRIRFLETPGHTPEGISLLVYDLSVSREKPHAVLTGDTLFIGDVGRPDLLGSMGFSSEGLAGILYDTLHQKLLTLPDETLVYPAHGAGSLCGRNLSTDTVSTIGEQRGFNYALQPMSKSEFVALITNELPAAPSYFGQNAMLNRIERATARQDLDVNAEALSVDDVLRIQAQGGQVLDVRDPADFAGAHLRGSINVGLSGAFAQWAGEVLDFDSPIALVGYPGGEQETVTRLRRVGLDNTVGFLAGGMQALEDGPGLVDRTERVTAGNLAEQLAGGRPPLAVDVRAKHEWDEGHIPGSVNIPLLGLQERLGELPRGRALTVYCASGYRSSVAASLLQRAGTSDITELVGGMAAWQASKLTVEHS